MKKYLEIVKNHKKKAIALVLIVGIVGFFALRKPGSDYETLALSETTEITQKDFVNSVTEAGKVKSEKDSLVYAEKLLPVKTINIKVGDVVKEGQIIAVLDASSIEQQIAMKNASITTSDKNAEVQIKNATDQLNRALRNKEDGTNAQVVAAENAVTSAYDAWQAANKTYEDYKNSIEQGYNDQILAANSSKEGLKGSQDTASMAYTQAKQKLDKATNALLDARFQVTVKTAAYNQLLERKNKGEAVSDAEIAAADAEVKKWEAEVQQAQTTAAMAKQEVDQQDSALYIANKNVKEAEKQQKLAERSRADVLSTYKNNADSMKRSYDAAVKNLKIAKIAADDEIASLKNSLSSAKKGADNLIHSVDLKYLKADLAKTVIKAPISGTITEMNMIKGQTPQNYVAKIETVKRIIVDSSVKEFDLNDLHNGMKVEITSDALGSGRIFKGKLSSVNPTPLAPTVGATTSSEVLYGTKIAFADKSIKEIKPGMSVRVKYIIEKKENVYTVPSTAIYEKKGKSFVLVVDGDSGVQTIREIEVEVSSENDFETVITSKELTKKLRVVNSPDAYSGGMQVMMVNAPIGE